MFELSRKEIKRDPVFNDLLEVIKKNHQPGQHTQKDLIQNRHIKDFCQEARHFAILGDLYLHYDVHSWFKAPDGIQVKIISIGIYDDYQEYESARVTQLQSTNESEGFNLN